MNILWFLLLLAAGMILLMYTRTWVNIFGRLDWAERLLGPAGTYSAWKLIGVGCIVAGMIILRYY